MSELSPANPIDFSALDTPGAGLPHDAPNPTRRSFTRSGLDVSRYLSMHVLGALFPVTAGMLFFGWRALFSLAMVSLAAAGAVFVWRRVGRRGGQLQYLHVLWLSTLLGLTLPAHLLGGETPGGAATWPLLPAAGIALVILVWILGGIGSGRIHPVLVAYLLIVVLFQDLLVPHYVLQRHAIFGGDLLRATAAPTLPDASQDAASLRDKVPWTSIPRMPGDDAVWSEPASQRLESYTSGLAAPERRWTSLESLLRDRMPPLEDLIVGGQPAPIGCCSAVAIIIGGLFLLYRGVIDYRIPLLIFLTALICLLVLPIPVVITEDTEQWRWLAMHDPAVGWPLALTFANYELMASPLLFTAFFLATAPAVRPMTRRARTVFAVLVGAATAAFQLYVSVSIGPYLALLAVSLLTPTMDKVYAHRTLV